MFRRNTKLLKDLSHLNSEKQKLKLFEVFTAVTINNAVFWDVETCQLIINRRFEGTCRLHLQDTRNNASEEER
jgi:hypothetical protein